MGGSMGGSMDEPMGGSMDEPMGGSMGGSMGAKPWSTQIWPTVAYSAGCCT